jgi:hypothetical protein
LKKSKGLNYLRPFIKLPHKAWHIDSIGVAIIAKVIIVSRGSGIHRIHVPAVGQDPVLDVSKEISK